MKTLHCSDAGFDCKAVIIAATNEEVLKQAAVHVKEVHKLIATPELAQQLETLIKDEN
ncbi:MAG: DUF1059 domain-containing protein [Segetibacter sp.]|jgi:predicted small metal-binding protein|nr:DUF1059 domain-containing protein [Segetibacter sp.]